MTTAKNTWNAFKEAFGVVDDGSILCVFDTETTGLGSDAKIIQFSAIRWKVHIDFFSEHPSMNLEKIDFIDRYINPLEPLSEKIIELTGITDAYLADALPEEEYCELIYQYLASADVWIGHNLKFDIRMLDQMADRTGFCYEKRPYVDTLDLSRTMFPGKAELENHKLGTVADHLLPKDVLDSAHLHSAIDDVFITSKVFEAMMSRYMATDTSLAKDTEAIHVEYAYYFDNPRNGRQKRLKIAFIKPGVSRPGEDNKSVGDIFYDCIEHCWSCKATRYARKVFEKCDVEDIEKQVIQKYGWLAKRMFPGEPVTIDLIVKMRAAEDRERKRNKKETA